MLPNKKLAYTFYNKKRHPTGWRFTYLKPC